eukprot:gene517-biopygen60
MPHGRIATSCWTGPKTVGFPTIRHALIHVWVDSDFAGCKRTRKSTSGGVLCICHNVVKHWAAAQGIIALSTAESEYYSMAKGGAMAIGLRSLLADLGHTSRIIMHVDAIAAKAIAMRRGLGKVHRLDVHQLWLQARASDGSIVLDKVPIASTLASHMANHMAKCVTVPESQWFIHSTHRRIASGRHALAPALGGIGVVATLPSDPFRGRCCHPCGPTRKGLLGTPPASPPKKKCVCMSPPPCVVQPHRRRPCPWRVTYLATSSG